MAQHEQGRERPLGSLLGRTREMLVQSLAPFQDVAGLSPSAEREEPTCADGQPKPPPQVLIPRQ